MTTTTTLAKFIIAHRSHMRAEQVLTNPYLADDSWPNRQDHWRCEFTKHDTPRRTMVAYFSMGSGHNGRAPLQKEVLDCLASDAASYENAKDFEDWARDFGYDTDSRKAERTYRIVGRLSAKLKRYLGDAAYDELLWHCERE